MQLQREQLGSLLRHAHGHVPYYGRVLEACGAVDSAGRVDLEAFTAIYLNKDASAARARAALGPGPAPVVPQLLRRVDRQAGGLHPGRRRRTSGGGPRPSSSTNGRGAGRGSRSLLWGSERDLRCEPGLRKSLAVARGALWLSTPFMTPGVWALRGGPQIIPPDADPGVCRQPLRVARYVRGNTQRPSPAGIMTSAESIYPEQRALIERVFDAPS